MPSVEAGAWASRRGTATRVQVEVAASWCDAATCYGMLLQGVWQQTHGAGRTCQHCTVHALLADTRQALKDKPAASEKQKAGGKSLFSLQFESTQLFGLQ